MRQAFDKGFFVGGALASAMTVTKGARPNGRFPTASERGGAARSRPAAPRAIRRRTASYIFDKLVLGLRLGQPDADDQPNHLKVRTTVRATGRGGVAMDVPAHVYEVGRTSATAW